MQHCRDMIQFLRYRVSFFAALFHPNRNTYLRKSYNFSRTTNHHEPPRKMLVIYYDQLHRNTPKKQWSVALQYRYLTVSKPIFLCILIILNSFRAMVTIMCPLAIRASFKTPNLELCSILVDVQYRFKALLSLFLFVVTAFNEAQERRVNDNFPTESFATVNFIQ